jgi:hypothetical protein
MGEEWEEERREEMIGKKGEEKHFKCSTKHLY